MTKDQIWEIQGLRSSRTKLPWLSEAEVIALATKLGVATMTQGFPCGRATRDTIEERIKRLVKNRKWNRVAPWPENRRDIVLSSETNPY